MQSLALVAAVVILAPALPARARQPADLHATLDAVRQKQNAPGLAGAIIRDGEIIGVGVCGVRSMDPQEQEPAAIDDRWPVGSCTKPMTRFMLGRLMERGDLSPDATLASLLPAVQMREDYRAVPLWQVLAHRAGIQPYTQIGPRITPFIFKLKGPPKDQRAAFAAHVLNEEPAAPPGEKFVYSNAGYCVAAVIAETKTAQPWEALMRDEVLTPLGMSKSIAGPETDPDHQPRGHERTPGGYITPRGSMPGLAVMFPAGGVKASAADFARFAGAYADIAAGRPVGGLSAATARKVAEMRPADRPATSDMDTFFGGDGQYTAAFAVWPSRRLAIAVASNAGESDDLCAAAIEAIRAAQAPELPPQTRPGGPQGNAPPGPRYGVQIQAEDGGDGWSIAGVEPGSIAEKAGLKEADRIVAINGRSLKDIPEDERAGLIRAARVKLTVERDGKRIDIEMSR